MLTWGNNGQWCKVDAEDDIIRGPQRLRSIDWYATGATAGTTLLSVTELSSETPICTDVAAAAQFSRELPVPEGLVQGIKVTDMDEGYLIVYFAERPAERVTAKAIHEATPAA